MSQMSKKMLRLNLKRTLLWRVTILRRCVASVWHQILACWIGKSIRYRQLLNSGGHLPTSHRPPPPTTTIDVSIGEMASSCGGDPYVSGGCDSDLVALKISLLGDNQIGKTSFLAKYVGKEEKQEQLQTTGINQMDKILCVGGARISYSIWEVGGDAHSLGDASSKTAACKDSVAMLFMFDLTSRCTLNSVMNWYQQARRYNQTALPVMVGSKFDDFVQLPIDLQWTIASQARAYARAINATLFFSSASYNINVNKIFKFITARLFNLPWTLERNLTIGEPIIDF